MSLRNLLNLTLAGVAVGLGLLAYFRPGLEPPPAEPAVTALQPAQVRQIEVTRLQRPALTFTRREHGWLLAGEPPLPAGEFQIKALLGILEAQSYRHYPAATLDLQKLGLDPPQATIQLDGTTTLGIGATDPLDNLRYVLHGTTVYLVEDRYQHLINADRTNFIERRLLNEAAVITRLALPELTLSLGNDGQWESNPNEPAIGSEAIRNLITEWQQASALFIRPYEPGAGGPEITLDLAGGNKPVVFTLLSRTPELILGRPDLGIQYHFSKGMEKRLLEVDTTSQSHADDAAATD